MNTVCRYLLYLTFPLATLAVVNSVRAQSITPDGTLSTQVQSNDNLNFDITQGNRQGNNLFHSFKDFGVPNNGSARFLNQTDIANIFSRVTGGNISQINGLLQSQGTANLFLINPRGIVFGPNASLNVGGSFFASTASGILFNDGVEFSATDTQPSPLLSVNIPIGLRFRDNPGSITNRSIALQFLSGKTLALVGGDVNFEGGRVIAPGARVEIGGLSTEGIVGINDDLSLSFPEGVTRRDVSIINGGIINVTAGDGGFLTFNARNLEVKQGSQLLAGIGSGLGRPQAQAGDIIINATNNVLFSNNSFAFNGVNSNGVGNAGDISVSTGSLELLNGGIFSASTLGQGNSGKVSITARDNISFDNGFIFNNVLSNAVGKSEGIDITTGSLSMTNGARMESVTVGTGNSGKINITARDNISLDNGSSLFNNVLSGAVGNSAGVDITTGSLSVTNGSQIFSNTFGQGNSGKVSITARDNISFDNGFIFNNVLSNAVGKSEGIDITTSSLSMTNGAQMESATVGTGNSGKVNINARDIISLDNGSSIFNNVVFGGIGNSGGVDITTGSLSITNGSTIQSSTAGTGNSGKININARDTVFLDDGDSDSFISSNVLLGAVGNSKGINITTGSLFVTNGAQILSNTLGEGDSGKVTIVASDTISFDGQDNRGFPSAVLSQVREDGIGNSGGISITTKSLSITNGAALSSATFGRGDASDLIIQARDTVLVDGGRGIEAGRQSPNNENNLGVTVEDNAIGNGGNLIIDTGSFFAINGARISAATQAQGNAGNIIIRARDTVSFDESFARSVVNVEVQEFGNGGNIEIQTGNLSVTNGSRLLANTGGRGNAGNIIIQARDTVSFDGRQSEFTSGAFSNVLAGAEGKGGNINIQANSLFITNGAQLLADTSSKFNAGNIKLTIEDKITLSGSESGIFANTAPGSTGNGGNISIDPKTVEILDGARISADSQGTGKPGNIDIVSDELLLLRRGGTISTNSLQDTDGGNIKINTGVLVAVPNENSDITSNAVRGTGGRIDINALGIFGIEPRDALTDLSDITANSEFGLSGTITINNPEVDPNSGLIELPETVVDAKNQIAQNACRQGTSSELVATGRGGLPPNPTQDLRSSAVRVGLATPVASNITNTTASKPKPTPTVKKIVPAQGWVFNSKGQVVLTAHNPNQIGVQRTAHKALCKEK